MLNISNRISINTIGGGVFSVANSFLLDGVDEAFNGIDYAKLKPYIGGTNKQFTFLLIK